MAEIPALFGQRPIVHRHQKAAMYHPFVEGYVFPYIFYFIISLTSIPGSRLPWSTSPSHSLPRSSSAFSSISWLDYRCPPGNSCESLPTALYIPKLIPWGFSVFYLFLFTMSVTMKAWFRAIAAGFKSEATAQAVSGAFRQGLA